MKKIFAILAVSIVSLSAAQAQSSSATPEKKQSTQHRASPRAMLSPEERALRQTEAMEKKLSLSADQKAKVHQINLERIHKMEKLRNERQVTSATMQELKRENEKKLSSVLSKEQMQKRSSLQQDRNEVLQERMENKLSQPEGLRGSE